MSGDVPDVADGVQPIRRDRDRRTPPKPYSIQTTTPPTSVSIRFALAVLAVLRAFAAPLLLSAPIHHHQMPFLRSALHHVPQPLHPALNRPF